MCSKNTVNSASAPAILVVAQIILFQGVVLLEGPADPSKPALTPPTIAAVGLSTAITALLMTALVARMARVPWRAVFRHRRAFDRRRLGIYLLGSAPMVGLGLLVAALVAPESIGTFALGAATIVAIVATLVFSPLQSAGEEVIFRGAVIPAAGSWFRSTRLAVVFGILVSGALFAVLHVSLEPWFVTYLFLFSASAAIIGMLSGGMEAAIAFHVANNVIVGIVNALFAGDGVAVVDRGASSGPDPTLLVLMVMNVSVVALVWLVERAKRSRTRSDRGTA